MPSVRSPLTLRQLSGGAYLAGILLLAVGVVFALGRYLDDHFRRELSDRGRALVERLAEDSRLALIQAESDSLRPRLETALADPNVAGIVVATARGDALASAGPNPVSPGEVPAAGAAVYAIRTVETERALTLVVAVRPHPLSDDYFARGATGAAAEPAAPLGFVALTLTTAKLRSDLRAIGRHVLAVMGAGALLVTLLALGVLDRLTRPIKQLARTMADPEAVRHLRRVEVRGVREARVIATAYNALIARVADSRADLARQVEEAVREVMRQNAELVVAREKAEAASRAKSQFVATVSHEIRTPLHGVVGFVGLLAKTPLTDRQKTYLALLGQATDSLLAEINSILDFSQLEAGKMQPRERPFNLKELLETTLQQFDSRARAKRLNLRIAIDPRLPEWVCADRQSLEKILRNLVDNAIKFTSRGQIQVRVWGLRENESTFECHFAVRDTGIGISPEHRATIFQAFHQIDSSITRQQGGSGLGLSICRQLVELMKGRLTVKSRLGQGSTFYVEMPLTLSEPRPEWIADEDPAPPSDAEDGALPALPSPRDEAPSPRRPSKTHRLGGARVLVVDDQSQNRVYAQLALLELDAEVVTAASGHEALEACENQRFDLVLMDVRMPDMDGLEATRRIRQLWIDADSRTPIIGLTADLLNLDRQDWQNAGMDDCRFKPLGVEALNDIFVRWEIGPSAQSHSLSRFLRKRYER
jgi:two-component system sensor histidine kinase BarA